MGTHKPANCSPYLRSWRAFRIAIAAAYRLGRRHTCCPTAVLSAVLMTAPQPPVRRMGKGGHRARMPHRLLLLCLVEQGHGVRDARDEPAQAGEQQQFFDLPDHDVLPRRRSGDSNNDERELGFHARVGFHQEAGNSTRLSRPGRSATHLLLLSDISWMMGDSMCHRAGQDRFGIGPKV